MKTIKDAMIELITKSSEFGENFIFEKLQDYMNFEDNKATWINNIRLRMIENKEAREQGIEQNKEEVLGLIDEWADKNEGIMSWQEGVYNIGVKDIKELKKRINR